VKSPSTVIKLPQPDPSGERQIQGMYVVITRMIVDRDTVEVWWR
jgi:hypothetical protein